ncbi:MAG: type II/IV secretion system ATPase subunit, partial [Candidatus Aenigmarchaeota archaeon]|nr:type II/IV secretion system ATPase subunit [Candidatus Aenigmarchaeota archaeon]
MIKIRLKKPTDKVNLGSVFNAAVDGYKNLNAEEDEDAKCVPCAPYGYPVGIPMQQPEKPEEVKEEPKEETFIRRKKGPEVDPTTVNLVYPLIPARSRNPIAYSHIKWSRADNALLYKVVEPELSQSERELLKNIKTSLVEKLDVDFTTLKKGEAKDFLGNKFSETVNLMAASLTPEKRTHILYFIERDFIGLGKIEPLMQDADIEDVSCDGIGIPIYIYHRNPVIGSVKTNVVFDTADELDTFVNKLAQRCGKTVSVAKPLVNGSLPDGSRVQSTLGTDIARKGSNFTIRKFTKDP